LIVAHAIACAATVLCIEGGMPALANDVTATATALAPSDNPDFDSVTWTTLACGNGVAPPGDSSPSSTDIVGDLAHPATSYAWDASYLYFRFRMDGSPTGPRGFDQYAWVSLMQVPTGNAFQYQYELALNGKGSDDDFGNTGGQQGDTIEIWRNTTAANVDFSPLFNDPAETRLFAQRNDYAGPGTVNTTPLARIVAATDGSSFGGNADYFIDLAVPISVLIAKGVITGTSDIVDSLFFPATSTNPNQYNKDHLSCPFLPYTTLSITKAVAPTVVPTNASVSIAHTITVANTGQATAKGVVIGDTAFPSTLSGITVHVTSSDPTVTFTIASTNPLSILLPRIPAGASVTVAIDSTATVSCTTPAFVNTATAAATNALEVSATATLRVGGGSPEICDGKDNNCDGSIDEGSGLCNDGNACTQSDICQNGACVGTNPVVCTASDQCHAAGTCDPATGTCSNPIKSNGVGCSDGSACTRTDTCQNGACVGADPVSCTASDQCHAAGVCNPATGTCSNPNKSNGASCNDGNACTQNDTCQNGACVAAGFVVCTPSNQCHVAGTCDPATGACSNPIKSNGVSCSDSSLCTRTDTCQNGSCVGADPVSCTAADPCHDAGTCDPSTGACSNPNKPNGVSCSDGSACTRTDTCQNGTCVGANPVVCAAPDSCHLAGTCDTANGTCSSPVKANGASCNDGNGCTQTDTCQNGACTGSNQVICPAPDQCHLAGTCNAATGVCSSPSKSNGTACNDGNACTRTDTCQSGTCTGASPVTCTASDQCHLAGVCDTATGICPNPAKANGSSCSDGSACTSSDTCQSGACVAGPPAQCDDNNVCTNDGCAAASGCWHTPLFGPCNDGSVCTSQDACSNGVCVGGPLSWPGCTAPHSVGHYKHSCSDANSDDPITLDDVDCINDWSTFASVTTVAQVCAKLDPVTGDKCLQGESQFMAALLNLCKERLSRGQEIISQCGDNTTVAQSLNEANAILSNPDRTQTECVTAQCESEELDSGSAIAGVIVLYADLTSTSVRVRWYPPLGTPARNYNLWRRVRGVGSFAIITTTSFLTYEDTQIVNGVSYEYKVTVLELSLCRWSYGQVVVTRAAPAAPCTPRVPNVPMQESFSPRDRYQNPAPAVGTAVSTSVGPGRSSKQVSSPPPGPTGSALRLPRRAS
jgi:hypothetical protein